MASSYFLVKKIVALKWLCCDMAMVNDWTMADDRMKEILEINCIKYGATYIGRDDSKLGKETRCTMKSLGSESKRARLDKSQGTKGMN